MGITVAGVLLDNIRDTDHSGKSSPDCILCTPQQWVHTLAIVPHHGNNKASSLGSVGWIHALSNGCTPWQSFHTMATIKPLP